METKFIEQLVTTAPESLREITHTLRVDVEALLKAKSTKKFLVLEPYSHNTELCPPYPAADGITARTSFGIMQGGMK